MGRPEDQQEQSHEAEEIMTAFRAQRWDPDDDKKDWLPVALAVGVCLIAAWLWLRAAEPEPEPESQALGMPAAEVPSEPMRIPTMSPSVASPAVPRAIGVVGVYECQREGQRILSDRPCGPEAVERVVDTRGLNTYTEESPPLDMRRTVDRSVSAVEAAPIAAIQNVRPDIDQLCDSLQARIDWINARTRQKHSSREADYWRAEWHKAKNAYYDAGCGR